MYEWTSHDFLFLWCRHCVTLGKLHMNLVGKCPMEGAASQQFWEHLARGLAGLWLCSCVLIYHLCWFNLSAGPIHMALLTSLMLFTGVSMMLSMGFQMMVGHWWAVTVLRMLLLLSTLLQTNLLVLMSTPPSCLLRLEVASCVLRHQCCFRFVLLSIQF